MLPSSARVRSSLTSPSEMSRERSAETSALRERSTASVGGDSESVARLSTTRNIGNAGEQAAADWLAADGHEIIERNWRTRYCEIDIVSMKDGVLWFTEVKYRKNDNFGGGLGAITAKKQRQMRFAAEVFIAKQPQYEGCDMRLVAVAVEGNPLTVRERVVLE